MKEDKKTTKNNNKKVIITESIAPYLCSHIFEVYGLRSTDRWGSMVVNQLVERIELYYPQEILASTIPQYFEVLNATCKPGEKNKYIQGTNQIDMGRW